MLTECTPPPPSSLPGSVAEQVRRRQFPITGGGGGVWSFVHIADAAAATLLAALTRGGNTSIVCP